MLWKYVLSLRRCRQSETRTHDHAFRGHLLYHWATSPYWTSRLSCHLVEQEVRSYLIHYCQLRVIQLVSLVCWPPTTTPTEMWIFIQGNASAVLMISEFTHVMLKVCVKLAAFYFQHNMGKLTYNCVIVAFSNYVKYSFTFKMLIQTNLHRSELGWTIACSFPINNLCIQPGLKIWILL